MKNEMINGKTPEIIKSGLISMLKSCGDMCGESTRCLQGLCPYYGDDYCEESILSDAFALIEHLEAKVPKWIGVEEQLPKYVISVFVYARLCVGGRISKTGSTYISLFIPPTKSWKGVPDGWKVTHWMPKPEPQEEEEERHDDEGDHRGHHPLDLGQQGD